MAEEYDFYDLGQRYATETLDVIKRKADEYGKNFGAAAKRSFELGIISLIPQYAKVYPLYDEEDLKATGGSINFGVPELRNNSYFGGTGVGVQHDSSGHYNDPEKHNGRF